MDENIPNRDPNSQAFKLLQSFSVGMLTTKTQNGVHSRPMAIAETVDEFTLSMVCDVKSEKVEEIKRDSYALMTFQDKDSYLAIEGELSLENDKQHLSQLWNPHFEAWFPNGKEDPDVQCLIFRGRRGEYWSNEGTSKVKYAFEVAKAYLSGDQPRIQEGTQHGQFEKPAESIAL